MWTIAAAVCTLFAATPWVIIAKIGRIPSVAAFVVVMSAWTALPLGLAVYLLFFSLASVELTGGPHTIRRRLGFWLFAFESEFQVERAYLIRKWYHSKHSSHPRDVLIVRCGRLKRRLADELICADLPGLLAWIAASTDAQVRDARHRAPIGV